MDFNLSREHQLIRKMMAEFTEKEVKCSSYHHLESPAPANRTKKYDSLWKARTPKGVFAFSEKTQLNA